MSISTDRFGVVAFILLLGSAVALGLRSLPTSSSPSDGPPIDTLRAVADGIVSGTNREREAAGLDALRSDPGLRALACRHTRDMLVRDFTGHVNPDGVGPGERAARHHRRLIGSVGENVLARIGGSQPGASALATDLVTRWMNSPEHRKNILRRGFTHLGVCVMRQGDAIRAAQSFARVRGFLTSPLPRRAAPGRKIRTSVRAVPDWKTTASRYDLWDPDTGRRVVGPQALSNTLRLPDTTGTYRVRFYFPQDDRRYTVYQGPSLTLSPSP
jgi:uncharacterized protein YkwD